MYKMKGYLPLVSVAFAIIITATLPTRIAFGHSETPAYQAGAGVLSYSFFNLSGQSCTVTAYGAQNNPYSANVNSHSNWICGNSGSNNAFFNDACTGGDGNWVFYNNPDPIDTSTLPSTLTLSNGAGSGDNGQNIQIQSTATGQNWSINYPAMGDSWGVACGSTNASIATLASSGSSLQSGWYGSVVDYLPNSDITPTGSSNPVNEGCSANNTNPCGAGFAAQGMNWNPGLNNPNYQNMGALWSGINYTNTTAVPASSSLNFAILPINFSAYVQSNTGINFTDMTPNLQTYYNSIYGGHTGITVGDPFLISSISAKALWFLATSQFSLNNDTSVASIASTLSNTDNTGVFWGGSYEDAYIQWLVGSQSSSFNYPGQPAAAASAYNSAYKAASVQIEQTTIWGKIFSALADIALGITTAALVAIPGVGGVVAGGVAAGVGGIVTPDINSAIYNSNQYTISGAPPNPTQAPPVINDTFAATNLFGLFLSNTGVQGAINSALDNDQNPSPLWSNYDINTDSECSSSSIGVTDNLMRGSCGTNNSVFNGPDSNVPSGYYSNVYAAKQTSIQLSIWDAILSGSNITTNASGYMVTGGQGQYPSFSPPTLLVNASSSSIEANSIIVNTAFNPTSGNISASSIGIAQSTFAYNTVPVPATQPNYIPPPPLQAPPFINRPATTWTITIPNSGISYNNTTGIYAIDQYCISNNEITVPICASPTGSVAFIDMTTCVSDSLVLVSAQIYSYDQNTPTLALSLACQPPPTTLITNVSLDYSQCTNDQWASGGVYAAVTTPPNALGTVGDVILACACIPAYLDGVAEKNAPQNNMLGGYVIGATSSNSSQTCPAPAT